MTEGMTIKTEEPKNLGLMDILVVQDHQKIISLCNHWEPHLYSSVIVVGDGATCKRMCHTFKLLKGVSFNVPPKIKKKNPKEQQSQQTQPKQTQSPSKQ